jgi:mono/diheme cytochrome c family protein
MANCAMCHGEKGDKKYRDATDLVASSLNQEGIELIVREGTTRDLKRGQVRMPGFAGTLTDEEITAVSAYVQSLRK